MRVLLFTCVAAIGSGGLSAVAPSALGTNPLSELLVQQALQAELDDQPLQRKALLADALETDPGYAPARWHSGQVRSADGWRTVDEAAEQNSASSPLAEYRRLRNASPATAQAHLQLARFCRAQGLEDQARFHWTCVLAWMPDNAEALRALELRKVKNQYLTADQFKQARATERV